MSILDFHASATERQEADRLAKIDIIANGVKIHDLSVSCYTAECGEDGRPEDVHERKISDGTCRCGYHALLRWGVVITRDGTDGRGRNRVDTFTWGGSRRHAVARVAEQFDRDDLWAGWSFAVSQRPVGA